MGFRLVVEYGPDAGAVFDLEAGPQSVGRAQDSPICLPNDQSVSRNHGEFALDGSAVTYVDKGSTCGSWVNETPVAPGIRTQLRAGDRVRMGNTVLKVESTVSIDSLQKVDSPTFRPQNPADGCRECGAKFKFLGGSARSSEYPDLCNRCAKDAAGRVERFRAVLQRELAMWSGSPAELSSRLQNHAQLLRVNLRTALWQSKDVARGFLQRVLTFVVRDGHLEEPEERLLREYLSALGLSEQDVPSLAGQIRHYSFLRALHNGRLPSIRPRTLLPAGEIAHIEAHAAYTRQLTRTIRQHQGVFLVTNARVLFTETDYPFEAALSKVLSVALVGSHAFDLQLAKRQGTGYYQSPDAMYIVEVLRAALELHLRHRVLQQSSSRAIPHEIRTAVWQRDGGRCVECGDQEYLEYDHIIPFSKGGATSLDNLQLLCRRCNLAKGDRI